MEQNTGPVGIEDVRAALGEQDPAGTNAGALRRILGRGSLSTIQKHLDALRAQAVQPAAEVDGEAPKAPAELVQSLWAQAWSQAQALVQTALASALAKSEALATALGIAQQDAQAAQAEADQAQADFATVVARLESLEGQHNGAMEAAQQAHQEQVQALENELSVVRKQAEQARHELAVAQARHAADLAVLRGELDRQVSQLADLRAALQMRPPVPAPLVVAADQKAPDQSAS